MIEAEAAEHHLPDGDEIGAIGPGDDHGAFHDGADALDGHLGLVDDGQAEGVPIDAGIGDGESAAADLIGLELLGACAFGQVVEAAGQATQVHHVCVLHHGHNQTPVQAHGDAEVDVLLVDNVVAVH